MTLKPPIAPQNGASSVVEGLDTRLDLVESATDHRYAVPTGADDAPDLISRIAAGEKDVSLRRGTYKWNQQVVLTANTSLVGAGKRLTVVEKGFNGVLAPMGDGVDISHMSFDGKGNPAGDNRTGKGFAAAGADGRQTFTAVRVFDFDDYCLDFAIDAGSQSKFLGSDFARYDGLTAGRYAVRIADSLASAGRPRHFIGCGSEGAHFIALGGTNDTFITGCIVGEILFSANTLAAIITGSRLGGLYAAASGQLHVLGFNNVIEGCDVYPQVVIDATYHTNVVGPNSYNVAGAPTSPAVIDNSGSELNLVYSRRDTTWAPAITAGGTAPAIGDGTLAAKRSRHGSTVQFSIVLTAGSTTTLGTGELRFAIPLAPVSGAVQTVVAGFLDASTGINYTLQGQIAPGTSYVRFHADGVAGSLGQGNLPGGVAIATGDVFRVAGSYDI